MSKISKKLTLSLVILLCSLPFLAMGCAGMFLADKALICAGFCVGVPIIIGGALYTIRVLHEIKKEGRK